MDITIDRLHATRIMDVINAEDIAEANNRDEDEGWSYRVEIMPSNTTRARVAVYDEQDNKLGYL